MIGDPDLRALCKTMMQETRLVHEALDVHIPLARASGLYGELTTPIEEVISQK